MSTISPAKEGIWEYERSGFYVTVSSQDKKLHRHRRANVRELIALFHPSSGRAHTSDPTAHWYNAQCLHYGLKPSTVKGTAYKRLLEALNNEHLVVPSWIRNIERRLKRNWVARITAGQASLRQDRREDTIGQSSRIPRDQVPTNGSRDAGAIAINGEPSVTASEPAVGPAARSTSHTAAIAEAEARKRKRDQSRGPTSGPGSVVNTLPRLPRESPLASEASQRQKKQRVYSNNGSKDDDDRNGPDRNGKLPTRAVRADVYTSSERPVPASSAGESAQSRRHSQSPARRTTALDQRASPQLSSCSSLSSLTSDEEDDLPLLIAWRRMRLSRLPPTGQPQRVPDARAAGTTPAQSSSSVHPRPLVPVNATPSRQDSVARNTMNSRSAPNSQGNQRLPRKTTSTSSRAIDTPATSILPGNATGPSQTERVVDQGSSSAPNGNAVNGTSAVRPNRDSRPSTSAALAKTGVTDPSGTSTDSPSMSTPTPSQPLSGNCPPLVNGRGKPRDTRIAIPRASQGLGLTSTAPRDAVAAVVRAPSSSGNGSNPHSQTSESSLHQRASSAASAEKRPVKSSTPGGAVQDATIDSSETLRADASARVQLENDTIWNRRSETPEDSFVFQPFDFENEPKQESAPITSFPQESQEATRQSNGGANSRAEARAPVPRPEDRASIVHDLSRPQTDQTRDAPPPPSEARELQRTSPSCGLPNPRGRPPENSSYRMKSYRSDRYRSRSPRRMSPTRFATPVSRHDIGGGRLREYPSAARPGSCAPPSRAPYYQRPMLDSWTPSYSDSTRDNRRSSLYGSARRRSLSPPSHSRYCDNSRDNLRIDPEPWRQYERQEHSTSTTHSDTHPPISSRRNSLPVEDRRGRANTRYNSSTRGTLPRGQKQSSIRQLDACVDNENRATSCDDTADRTACDLNAESVTSLNQIGGDRQADNGSRDQSKVEDQHPSAARSAIAPITSEHQSQQNVEDPRTTVPTPQSPPNQTEAAKNGREISTKRSGQSSPAKTSSQLRKDSETETGSCNTPKNTINDKATSSKPAKASLNDSCPATEQSVPSSASLRRQNPSGATRTTARLASPRNVTQSVESCSTHKSSPMPTNTPKRTTTLGSHNLVHVQTRKVPKSSHPAIDTPATAATPRRHNKGRNPSATQTQPRKIKTEEGATTRSPQIALVTSSEIVTSKKPTRTSIPLKSKPSEAAGTSGLPDHGRNIARGTAGCGKESVTVDPSPILNPSNRLRNRVCLPSHKIENIEGQTGHVAAIADGSALQATPSSGTKKQRPSLFLSYVYTEETARNLFSEADKLTIADVVKRGKHSFVCTFTSLENAIAAYTRLPKDCKIPLRPGQKCTPKVQWFEDRQPRSLLTRGSHVSLENGDSESGKGQETTTSSLPSKAGKRRASALRNDNASHDTAQHAGQTSKIRDISDRQAPSNHRVNPPLLADAPPTLNLASRFRTGDIPTKNNNSRGSAKQKRQSVELKNASPTRTRLQFSDSENISTTLDYSNTQDFAIRNRSEMLSHDDSYGISIRGHASLPKSVPMLLNMPTMSAGFDTLQPSTLQGFDLHHTNSYMSGYPIAGPVLHDSWRDNSHIGAISPSPFYSNGHAINVEPFGPDCSNLPDVISIKGAAKRERRHTLQAHSESRHKGHRNPSSPLGYTECPVKSLETRVSFRRPS